LRRAVCSNNYYIGEYKRQYKCIFAYDSYWSPIWFKRQLHKAVSLFWGENKI
jgi:hypothetical protein